MAEFPNPKYIDERGLWGNGYKGQWHSGKGDRDCVAYLIEDGAHIVFIDPGSKRPIRKLKRRRDGKLTMGYSWPGKPATLKEFERFQYVQYAAVPWVRFECVVFDLDQCAHWSEGVCDSCLEFWHSEYDGTWFESSSGHRHYWYQVPDPIIGIKQLWLHNIKLDIICSRNYVRIPYAAGLVFAGFTDLPQNLIDAVADATSKRAKRISSAESKPRVATFTNRKVSSTLPYYYVPTEACYLRPGERNTGLYELVHQYACGSVIGTADRSRGKDAFYADCYRFGLSQVELIPDLTDFDIEGELSAMVSGLVNNLWREYNNVPRYGSFTEEQRSHGGLKRRDQVRFRNRERNQLICDLVNNRGEEYSWQDIANAVSLEFGKLSMGGVQGVARTCKFMAGHCITHEIKVNDLPR